MAFKIDIRNQQKTPREKVVLIGTGKGTIHIEPQSSLHALDAGKDWVLKDARLNISVAPKQVVYLNITSVVAPQGYKFGVKLKFEGNPYEKVLGYNQEGSLLTLTVLHNGSIDAEIEEQQVWAFAPPPHASTFALSVNNQMANHPVLYEAVSAVLPGNPMHSLHFTQGDLYTMHGEVKAWVLSEACLTISINEKFKIPLKIIALPSQQKGYLSAVRLEYGQNSQTLNYNDEASLICITILPDGSVEATIQNQKVKLHCPPHPSTFSLNVYNQQENRPDIGYIPYRAQGGMSSTNIMSGNCFFNQFPEAVLWSLNRAELSISVAARQLIYLNIEAVSGEETGTNHKSGIRFEYGNQVKYLAYNTPDSMLTLWVSTTGEIEATIGTQSVRLDCPPHPSNFVLHLSNELNNEQAITSHSKTVAGKSFENTIFSKDFITPPKVTENNPTTEEVVTNSDEGSLAVAEEVTVMAEEPKATLITSTLEIPLNGYTAHFHITSVSGLAAGGDTTSGVRLEYGGWSEYLGYNTEGSLLNITVEADGTVWAEVEGKGVEFPPASQNPEILKVPEDFRTIQAAIDAAHEDSVILLAPGTYQENIDFTDKNVLVASLAYLTGQTKYIAQTVIKPTDSIVFAQNDQRQTGFYGLTLQQTNDDLVITYRDSIPSFQNCVFVLEDIGRAALVARNNSLPLFRNCTIVGGNYAFVISSGANVMIDNSIIQSEYLVRTHNVEEMHRVMPMYSTLFLENDRSNKQFLNYNSVGFKTNSSSKPIFINPQANNYRLRDTSSAKRTGRNKSEAGAYNLLPTMKFQEIFSNVYNALKNPLFVYDNDQLWIQWQPSDFVDSYDISIKDLDFQIGQLVQGEHLSATSPSHFVQESISGQHEFVLNKSLEAGKTYEITIAPKMSEEIVPLAHTFHLQLEAAPQLYPNLLYFAQNNLIKVYWEQPTVPAGNLILLLRKNDQLLALERDLVGSDFSWTHDISTDELYEALFLSQQITVGNEAYEEGEVVQVTISPVCKTSVMPLDITPPELSLHYEEGSIEAQWNSVGEAFAYDFKCWEDQRQDHPSYTKRTQETSLSISANPVPTPSQNGVHEASTSDKVWMFAEKHEKIERGKEYIAQVRVVDKDRGYVGAWSQPQRVFALLPDDLPPPEVQIKYTEGHLEMRWQAVRYAQGYDIDIVDAETDEVVYQKTKFMQTFLFVHDGIDKGKNYRVKIRAVAMRTVGNWSEPAEVFTLEANDLATPEVILQYSEEGMNAKWQVVEFAQSYEVILLTEGESEAITDPGFTVMTENTHCQWNEKIEKYQTYQVKVRAMAGSAQGRWSKTSEIIAIDTEDLTPPSNIVLDYAEEAIQVSWEAMAYAQKYELIVKDQASGNVVGDTLTVDATTASKASGIDKGKMYEVQVRSMVGDKAGEWSDPYEVFTLVANDLETPQINLTNPDGSIEVNWEVVDFAQNYEVLIKDGTTGEKLEENREISEPTCTFTENIEKDKIYEVQVRALAKGMQGEWSAARTIKVKHLEDKLEIIKQRLSEQKDNKGFYVLNDYTLGETALYDSLKASLGVDEIELHTPKDLQEQSQQILLSGTTPSLFGMPSLNIQLILMNQGGEVQTTMHFQMPRNWTFADSFASLKHTYFKELQLQDAQFTYSSIGYLEASWQVPITPGLNFYAKTTLNESLEVIQHLNGKHNNALPLSGKVAIKNGLPVIQLQFTESKFELNYGEDTLPIKALLQTVLADQEAAETTEVRAEVFLYAEADFLANARLSARLTDPKVDSLELIYEVSTPVGQTAEETDANDLHTTEEGQEDEEKTEEKLSSEELRTRKDVEGETREDGRKAEDEVADNNLEDRESVTEPNLDNDEELMQAIESMIGIPKQKNTEALQANLQESVMALLKGWVGHDNEWTSLLPEKYHQEILEEMPVRQVGMQVMLQSCSIVAMRIQLELSNWAALAPYYSINSPRWVVSAQYPFDKANLKVQAQLEGFVSLSGIYVPFVAQAPGFELVADCIIDHNLEASDLILDYGETSDVPLPGSLPNFSITRLELRIEPLSGEFYVTGHSETPWEIEVTHDKGLKLQNVGLTIRRVLLEDDLKVKMHFFGFIKSDDTQIRLIAERTEGNWVFNADRNFEHQLPVLPKLIGYLDDHWKNEIPQSLAQLSNELLLKHLEINLGLDKAFNLLVESKPGWTTDEFLPTVVSFGLQNFELSISKQSGEEISGHLSGEFDLGKKIFFPLIFALPFDEKNYLFSLVHFNEELSTPQFSDLLALANPDWEHRLPDALQHLETESDLEIQNFQLLYLEDNADIPEKTFIMEVSTSQNWEGWQLIKDTNIWIDHAGLRIFRSTNDLQSEFDFRLFGNLPIGTGAVSLSMPAPFETDIHSVRLDSILEQPSLKEMVALAAPTLVNALPKEIASLEHNVTLKDITYSQASGTPCFRMIITNTEDWEGWQLTNEPVPLHLSAFELHIVATLEGAEAKIMAPVEIFGEQTTLELPLSAAEPMHTAILWQPQAAQLGDVLRKLFDKADINESLQQQTLRNFSVAYSFAEKALLIDGNCGDIRLEGLGLFEEVQLKARLEADELPSLGLQGKWHGHIYETFYPFKFLLPQAGQDSELDLPYVSIVEDDDFPAMHRLDGANAAHSLSKMGAPVTTIAWVLVHPPYLHTVAETAQILKEQTRFDDINAIRQGIVAIDATYEEVKELIALLGSLKSKEGEAYFTSEEIMEALLEGSADMSTTQLAKMLKSYKDDPIEVATMLKTSLSKTLIGKDPKMVAAGMVEAMNGAGYELPAITAALTMHFTDIPTNEQIDFYVHALKDTCDVEELSKSVYQLSQRKLTCDTLAVAMQKADYEMVDIAQGVKHAFASSVLAEHLPSKVVKALKTLKKDFLTISTVLPRTFDDFKAENLATALKMNYFNAQDAALAMRYLWTTIETNEMIDALKGARYSLSSVLLSLLDLKEVAGQLQESQSSQRDIVDALRAIGVSANKASVTLLEFFPEITSATSLTNALQQGGYTAEQAEAAAVLMEKLDKLEPED
ncbi:hypothetical protein [uncultured Microscilla sp.]|uniref:hypothetical protein n=1 Tax=uncultured Microscilla sp. TaxID=432653 RepID=UPI002619DA06|nr:hypothetical protein [uncultured Microscilla sp.]